MKLTRWFVVLSAVFLLPRVPLAAQAPSIIEPKVERHQGPPLWISAEAVADEKKILNLDLIGSNSLRSHVEKQRQDLGARIVTEKSWAGAKPPIATISRSECKSTMGSSDHRGGDNPSATLEDLAAYSQSIVRGAIRAVEPGFSFGEPGSLLEVVVLEVLEGPGPKSPFFIDYPIAHFRVGPLTFCNLNTGFEPRPGDEVLLFDYAGPVDRNNSLYVPRFDQLFFEDQSGVLILPSRLKDAPDLKAVRSLDEVVGLLRSGTALDSRGGAR
ncbi:MAG TPA: hypothetical protein VEW48_09675 [Thermoanaerobaculia bacterium]|nr:hypothetical protein [Thermoanaerobaculia bacterium]